MLPSKKNASCARACAASLGLTLVLAASSSFAQPVRSTPIRGVGYSLTKGTDPGVSFKQEDQRFAIAGGGASLPKPIAAMSFSERRALLPAVPSDDPSHTQYVHYGRVAEIPVVKPDLASRARSLVARVKGAAPGLPRSFRTTDLAWKEVTPLTDPTGKPLLPPRSFDTVVFQKAGKLYAYEQSDTQVREAKMKPFIYRNSYGTYRMDPLPNGEFKPTPVDPSDPSKVLVSVPAKKAPASPASERLGRAR